MNAPEQIELARTVFSDSILAEFDAINPGSFEIVSIVGVRDFLKNLFLQSFQNKLIFTIIDTNSYRIIRNTPSFLDQEDKTLAPEFGPVFESQTISYEKGCYSGQEILMRMHSRGHTNRLWKSMRWSGPIEKGDEIFDENKAKIGTITYAIESPSWGWLSGAMLHRNALASAKFYVRNSFGTVIE